MDNPNGSSGTRRRRWDDNPAPASTGAAPSNLPAPPPSLPTVPPPPPINVQEAKRLAALKAAELAAKVASSSPSSSNPSSANGGGSGGALSDRPSSLMATASGFTQDIDINDCRNRYLLTKADTQRQIKADTGCEITTRGQYLPDRAQATAARPPLHLHVSATTRESLESAVAKIKELMDRPMDPLLNERASFAPRRHDPRDDRDGDDRGGDGYPGGGGPGFGRDRRPPPLSDKVFIDFAVNDRRFNVRAKVVGPKGSYVKHIQTTTGVRIQLKGQGSGYTETATGRESDEDLHVHLWTTQPNGEVAMKKAKELLEDLLASVRAEYDRWNENNNRSRDTMGGMGGPPGHMGMNLDSYRPGGADLGGDRDRDRPPMDMHYQHQAGAPAGDYAHTGADTYAGAYAGAPVAYAPSEAAPQPPAPPQYLHQPPYAAPEPPKHIVKTTDDRTKYAELYAQFYCHYFQLASEGKPMPVVEVPEAPEGEADEQAAAAADTAQAATPATEQAAVPAKEQAETPTATGPEGQAQQQGGEMDPTTAAQWQQYYAQYYASMGYPPSTDASATGTVSADGTTTTAGASAATLPGSTDAAAAQGGHDADTAAQWAAYYAYYGTSATAGAGAGEDAADPEQQS